MKQTFRSIRHFIVTPDGGKVLNDTTESGIILHSMMGAEDGRFLNRLAHTEVEPLVNHTSATAGDTLLVSHNVFRKWQDYGGELEHSNMIGDGQYFLDSNNIYAYKNDEWYSTNKWIIVDPVDHEYKELKGVETLRPDKGVIAFKQDPKHDTGQVKQGDFVTFRAGKFVTTIIDGKTYYRIMGKHILLNHGPH